MRSPCIAFVAGAWWLQQQATLVDGRLAAGCCAAAFLCVVVATTRPWRRRASPAVDDVSSTTTGPGSGGAVRTAARPSVAAFATRSSEPIDRPGGARPTFIRRASLRGGPVLRRAFIVGCAFVVGFGWASWRAERRLADALPPSLEGRDIVVVGVVAALPDVDPRGVRFAFDVESVVSVDDAGHPASGAGPGSRWPVPSHLSLGWYRPGRGTVGVGAGAVPDVRPGQRWRLTVRLKRPHGTANPSGFDYEYWLLEQGFRATGSVRPGADDNDAGDDDRTVEEASTGTRKLDEFVWRIDYAIERARERLRHRVMTALTGGGPVAATAPYAGVVVALIIGDQRAIAQSDWTVFNRTGIGHLVSISGLHVSMLAALGAWGVSRWWRRHPAWCARLAAHRAAALAGTLVALAYCLLAGFGVPAQRTLYMIGVVALALWTHRLTSVSRVLCIALAIVVAIDPWAVMGSGFWLSFTAVAAIFYVGTGRLRPHAATLKARMLDGLRAALRMQWAVTLALTPLTLLFFFQMSIVSPLANAVAIPLVSFVVTPLALAGAVLPTIVGSPLLRIAHGVVALLATGLQWLSASPIAVWSAAAPGPVALACAMIGVAWWLAPRGLANRWTGALWLVPLFAWPTDRPAPGDVRFVALDIGQGTSVVVQTHGSDLLYDTGPSYGPGNDAGQRIIVPYLRAAGISRLDTLVVSHNDNDHSGGALSVLAAIPVSDVRSSLAFDTPIVRASPNHLRCATGQGWSVDDVRFDVLSPPSDIYAARDSAPNARPNARSCVLRVESRGRVMLLTADIEKPQEAALVERAAAAIVSDVMLVPHHGSRTSSTDAFLDATTPSIAIVQAGYLNRFGHPRADVMARYAARGITVFRNDRDGAVTVAMIDGQVTVDRYRKTHPRYWYPP